MSNHKSRARNERVAIQHLSLLEQHDGEPIVMLVTDVSQGGFKAECTEPAQVAENYVLNMGPAGIYQVRVCWRLGSRLGGEFLKPLSWAQWLAVVTSIYSGEPLVKAAPQTDLI
jgi:hypothetical protein